MVQRIAYFTNRYPAVSHTFIRREILGLERAGLEVHRFALRGWDEKLFDPQDEKEREQTQYLLRDGLKSLMGSLWRILRGSPWRFARALALTWKMSRRSVRPLPYHLIYLAEACRLLERLSEAQIEHVHVHFATNPTEVVMLARALGGPPFSFTVHGPDEFNNIDYYGLDEKIARSAAVVAITHFTRSQLCRTVRHEHWEKIRVVRCGLEPVFFPEAPSPVPDRPRFATIGRLVEQKGQLILVEAAARLRDEGRDFSLVIMGGGPMREELEALILKLNLQDRVELTGPVGTERVTTELKEARGLVLPSFAEGLPMVIMEAMALGRPVISTYIAGIPELVVPEENGWLVPAGSVDRLVDAMRSLLDTPTDRLTEMGRAGYERTREHHVSDLQAVQLAQIFGAEAPDAARRPPAQSGADSAMGP